MKRICMLCILQLTLVYLTCAEEPVTDDCLESTASIGEKIPWDDENFVIKNALESQTPENDADYNIIEKVRNHLKDNVEFDYCAEKGDMGKLMEEIKVMRERQHRLLIITSVLTSVALLISFTSLCIALTSKRNQGKRDKRPETQLNDGHDNRIVGEDQVTQVTENNSEIVFFKKTDSQDKEEVL